MKCGSKQLEFLYLLYLVQMLIDKYKDTKLDNINSIEQMSEDILKVLAIAGMKYYSELREEFE